MTRPPQTWGKGSKAFTRYEEGRLVEEDAVGVGTAEVVIRDDGDHRPIVRRGPRAPALFLGSQAEAGGRRLAWLLFALPAINRHADRIGHASPVDMAPMAS